MTTTRLLILDDEDTVASTIALLAENAGHLARYTTDPEEFLDLHLSWGPTHLAIDLVMPRRDGLSVLGALAEVGCSSAIIISSGVGGRILDAARRFATENGLRIAGVLAKPFRASALEALLDRDVEGDGGPADRRDGFQDVPVADLRESLDTGEGFDLAFQPKVTCRTGALAGFEALSRWQHPRIGPVPPPVFIGLAERHGLIGDLTDVVVERALAWFSSIPGHDDLTLSVNLSGSTLADPGLVGHLTDSCARHGIGPDSLVLELTETSRTDDPVRSLELLTRLRMHGFQLSLDDFGTGYSSMSELARLPFSEIKVDQSFVRGAAASQDARAVVRSVIDLGHDLGLETTAEGVEDADTLELLCSLGSDLAQGYHIARPMTGEQAAAWAATHAGPPPGAL